MCKRPEGSIFEILAIGHYFCFAAAAIFFSTSKLNSKFLVMLQTKCTFIE